MKGMEKCSVCGALLKTEEQKKSHRQFLKQQSIKTLNERALDKVKVNNVKKLKRELNNEKFNSQNNLNAIVTMTDWQMKEMNKLTAELKESKKVIKTLTKELKEQQKKQGEKNIIIEPIDENFSNLKTSKFDLTIDATKKYDYKVSYKDLNHDKQLMENMIDDLKKDIADKNAKLQTIQEELENINFFIEASARQKEENPQGIYSKITDEKYQSPVFGGPKIPFLQQNSINNTQYGLKDNNKTDRNNSKFN